MGKLKKVKKDKGDSKAAAKAAKKAKGEKKAAGKDVKAAKKQTKGKGKGDKDDMDEDDLIRTLEEFRNQWAAEHKVSGEQEATEAALLPSGQHLLTCSRVASQRRSSRSLRDEPTLLSRLARSRSICISSEERYAAAHRPAVALR